jgi:hypothetical protein
MVPKLTRSSGPLKPGRRPFDSVRDHSWTFGAAVAQRHDTPEAASSNLAMSTHPDRPVWLTRRRRYRRVARFDPSGQDSCPLRRLVDAGTLMKSRSGVRSSERVRVHAPLT